MTNRPSTAHASLRALLALVACLLVAIGTAFAQDPAAPPVTASPDAPAPSPATDGGQAPGAPDASAEAPAPPAAMPAPPAAPPPMHASTFATNEPFASGFEPMPGGAKVPLGWLPPGAFDPDRGPSTAIFPPQTLTLRFNHKLHVKGQKLGCVSCHKGVSSSESSADKLTPQPTVCDTCHGTDHSDLAKVMPGADTDGAPGKCNFCHRGYKEGDGNLVARLLVPRPNLRFNHKKHVSRNIGCTQCHGEVQELELATRDQLPRMRGCFGCHQRPDSASRGDAKSACATCHLSDASGKASPRMQTVFASGTLEPPRWMHNAEHGPDFVQRHKYVAANDSQFCASCHKEEYCTGCHDGRVRPRNIHPNDYLSMHPVEARLATQKCTSCHREQSFCVGCHQRLGVAMSSPSDVRNGGRFHPPKSEWSDAPRKPGHHAYEAMRNLNACVSCHIERDCVVCHGGQGIGGGFNPHPGSFTASCSTQLRRNPRPCYVCHAPGATELARCQ